LKAAAAIPSLIFALFAAAATAAPAVTHFANADDDNLVDAGGAIYSRTCAACHGRQLQGQPLWQFIDKYAGRRAPAHDATGHTWQHSDEDLFHMTKFGRFPSAPPHSVSYMPAFAGYLSDHEILAVIAYIKADWPLGLRASQAMLNPGMAGMPKGADHTSWTLPPNCTGTFQRWSAAQPK
jgi:mono/diheme cytochrome c family protein